jgi:hypothetical protein
LFGFAMTEAYHSDWFCNEECTKFPTHEELCAHVPPFKFRHDHPDLKDPTFYCGWEIPSCGFKWIIMFYDPSSRIAFGYADMGEAEYGVIVMDDIRESFEKFKKSFKMLFAFRETFKTGKREKSELSHMFC